MNNAVMANEARAVGREIAEPTTAPATLESSQVDWENRFTPNALPTDHLPLKKLAEFTPAFVGDRGAEYERQALAARTAELRERGAVEHLARIDQRHLR